MSKVLKITKPDKTVHVVPINEQGVLPVSQQPPQPAEKKWKLEEIDEADAKESEVHRRDLSSLRWKQ
jgi:hypothetical protein